MAAVTRLAALTKATVDEGLLGIYADNLESLSDLALRDAFTHAELTCKYLPTVGELRELVGLEVSRLEQIEADAAWRFVMQYLGNHGPSGEPLRVLSLTAEQRKEHKPCGGSGWVVRNNRSTRCECRKYTEQAAPAIPKRIEYALLQLGHTVPDALTAILDTEPKFQPRLRKQFDEAFERAKGATA